MSTTIFIDKEGNLQGLADDFIDSLDMGPKDVKRVSDVEFNRVTQTWEAHAPSGELIAAGISRSRVIEQERVYFNELMEEQNDPQTN
jgi:hypothetical protein